MRADDEGVPGVGGDQLQRWQSARGKYDAGAGVQGRLDIGARFAETPVAGGVVYAEIPKRQRKATAERHRRRLLPNRIMHHGRNGIVTEIVIARAVASQHEGVFQAVVHPDRKRGQQIAVGMVAEIDGEPPADFSAAHERFALVGCIARHRPIAFSGHEHDTSFEAGENLAVETRQFVAPNPGDAALFQTGVGARIKKIPVVEHVAGTAVVAS